LIAWLGSNPVNEQKLSSQKATSVSGVNEMPGDFNGSFLAENEQNEKSESQTDLEELRQN